ncbi:CPBP family intramembrane metalloprotease [Aestuariibacter sp. GS-14]|uniref:CPBP family intramembrane glutamic endopeptidase n=1 Tax=Aestuariibacter sp. GS-14 TaxID=2590670 RepID=UPI00112B1DF5|nr:CPBP family intramembrane glutamic endopeptidase [Aestuariibacter sp. GS-14]TPV54832.1 CPBP family intramembrane metalloprotease [Aestuariibacter sp. GS-14]
MSQHKALPNHTLQGQFWLPLLALFALTVVTQMSNVIYQKVMNQQSFADTLVPGMIFLSVLTLPALLIGLKLGRGMGMGLINQRALQEGGAAAGLRFAVALAIPLGLSLLTLRWLLVDYLPPELPAYGFRGPVGGLLVSVGAAVGEEIWFRFGLMTLLLFIAVKVRKTALTTHTIPMMMILLVGLGFGLAHLPSVVAYGAHSGFAVWATIAGNTAVAVLYGWCYWRYGLLSAITAHFSVDVVLHVLPALV